MAQTQIFFPVAVQVFLTLGVLIVMGVRRRNYLLSHKKVPQDMALAPNADWDEDAQKAQNNFANQFELPVLFFVACIFALALKQVDFFFLSLAWIFVIARVCHVFFHVGKNVVLKRAFPWFVSLIVVAIMWVALTVRALTAVI